MDSVGYRLVRAFRLKVRERAFAPLTVACLQADLRFDYTLIRQHEGPLWQLVTQQPPHLLDPRYPDWPALLLEAADATLAELTADGQPLGKKKLGDQNSIHIQHPFSRIPTVAEWLAGYADARSTGRPAMPRVQTPDNGSSERLVVAPGREEMASCTCPAARAVIPCRLSTGPGSTLGPMAARYRSCPDRRGIG